VRDTKYHPAIQDVRGFGCYFGVEIGGPDPNGFADRLLYRCLAKGLSFKVGGGKVVTLRPPLTIPLDEFDAGLANLDEALGELGG
jgi:4-aminobutyrate aminotransferase